MLDAAHVAAPAAVEKASAPAVHLANHRPHRVLARVAIRRQRLLAVLLGPGLSPLGLAALAALEALRAAVAARELQGPSEALG